jgi:hypothetical protein
MRNMSDKQSKGDERVSELLLQLLPIATTPLLTSLVKPNYLHLPVTTPSSSLRLLLLLTAHSASIPFAQGKGGG